MGIQEGGDPAYLAWELLGIGDDGLPIHLPLGVTEGGSGPETDSSAHHFVCWCSDPRCQLSKYLLLAYQKGLEAR